MHWFHLICTVSCSLFFFSGNDFCFRCFYLHIFYCFVVLRKIRMSSMEWAKVRSLSSEWKQLSGWMETRSGSIDWLPVRVPAAPLEDLHSCELGSLSCWEVNRQPALVPALYTSGWSSTGSWRTLNKLEKHLRAGQETSCVLMWVYILYTGLILDTGFYWIFYWI